MSPGFRVAALAIAMAAVPCCLSAAATARGGADPYRLRVAHAADVGAADVLLAWTDADAGKKAYKLYRRGGDGKWTDLAPLPPGATEYQDDGLSPASQYTYRLVTSNHEMLDTRSEVPGRLTFLAVTFPGPGDFRSEVSVSTVARSQGMSFPQRKSPGNTTYYVDGENGNDAGPGSREGDPWKSLERVNRVVLAPGDKVLFRAGGVYAGRLQPQGSGSQGAPIIIDKYGEGPNPRINAKGKSPEALLLHNVEYYEVSRLELTNHGNRRARGRAGIRLRAEDFGTVHHVHLKDLYVHDVNGDLHKGDGDQLAGFGIQWVCKGKQKRSCFDDLVIEDCRLARTDRNGICGASDCWERNQWQPSLHVVIRRNLLEDIGGDGIVPIACDGCLVEYNVLRGGRTRAPDNCAGIWPWSCDNSLLQFNEVSHMAGNLDGQGFDADYNCRNTVLQYNYSHDNDGGFLLVCNNGGLRMPHSVGCTGTIVRYNISQNDGSRLIQFGGPCENTKIYNNVFYVGKKRKLLGVLQGDWGGVGRPEDCLFQNNVFYVEGQLMDLIEAGKPPVFRNNVIFGDYWPASQGEKTISHDPMFVAPGSGGDGLKSLEGYKLKAGSPCIGAGVEVPNNGGRDFWGGKIPAAQPPAIGAHQP